MIPEAHTMFSYEEIRNYSETDIRIYQFIVSNPDKVQYMTVRELAKELHLSASTVLRFCNKNDFERYSDFKDALKKELTEQKMHPPSEDLQELSVFFARANFRIWDILQWGWRMRFIRWMHFDGRMLLLQPCRKAVKRKN